MSKEYWEKPVRVKKIAIVSPSLGLLGEPFVKHEKKIETGKKLITFIQKINFDDAKLFKNYFDEYINERMKNG